MIDSVGLEIRIWNLELGIVSHILYVKFEIIIRNFEFPVPSETHI